MPAKNSQKLYVKNGIYHIYNRGVDKRTIFQNRDDYNVMISYLKEYLSPKPIDKYQRQLTDKSLPPLNKQKIVYALQLNNFSEEIKLIAYALMPNHFHFLIRQHKETSMDQFMNSLFSRYTAFFNRKYSRIGPLFQGVYKAVRVLTDEQFLHLSRYIHRNHLALEGVALKTLSEQYNSYGEYLGLRKTTWIHQEIVLEYFSKENPHSSYQSFIEMTNDNEEILSPITIDAI